MSRRIKHNSSPAESWVIRDFCIIYQPLKQTHSTGKLTYYKVQTILTSVIFTEDVLDRCI